VRKKVVRPVGVVVETRLILTPTYRYPDTRFFTSVFFAQKYVTYWILNCCRKQLFAYKFEFAAKIDFEIALPIYAYTGNAVSKSIFSANSNLYAKSYFYREPGPQKREYERKNCGKKYRVKVPLRKLRLCANPDANHCGVRHR